MPRISLEKAESAKKAALQRFEALTTVTGVGITRLNGAYAVKLNLSEPVKPGVKLPEEIEGVPLKVEVTGRLRPR